MRYNMEEEGRDETLKHAIKSCSKRMMMDDDYT